MSLRYIEKPQVLIDAAFSRGRKAASLYPSQKTQFYTLKGREIAKIDASAEFLADTLIKTVREFPTIDKLPPFQRDLYECILDINQMKRSLSSISSVAEIIVKMRRQSIVRLKELRFTQDAEHAAKDVSRAYFGRVSSLIKSLGKPIVYYNESIGKLKELPSIDEKQEVYLLAGLPNVGKSTLLKKVTTSKPEIAAYPFTTKGLNVGTFTRKYLPIQVIDTPGLLDRPLHERNKIELKAISALQYLKGTVLYVVDPLDDLEKQKNLFDEIKKLFSDKGFIVVINKCDVAKDADIAAAKDLFVSAYVILEGNGMDNLKNELAK